jgi:hypothetical protein
MSAVLGILFLIVVVPYLASRVSQARNAAWTGPRTPGMRGRAVRAPGARPGTVRKAARSAGSAVAHPGSRHIRAQARAAAFTAWQQAFATDHLEQQRHARANGTAPATATIRPPSLWRRQPPAPPPASGGSASGNGNGRTPAAPLRPRPAAWDPAAGNNGRPCPQCGTATLGPGTCEYCKDAARNGAPQPAPRQPASSNGGTPVTAGTSTASAEKLIEGINEIHAHAAMGGIKTGKQEGIKASHEGLIRFAAMLVMLARQMSEPGMNYGPEITEPLAQAGQHCQAAAMATSEADAALSTLINMTVGDLAASPRQAPHHGELSESGVR